MFLENWIVYEIMLKNIVERCRPQMTTWNMRITCWLPKAAITISLCNILGFSTAKKGPKNAPHCYFTTTLPFSLVFCSTEC